MANATGTIASAPPSATNSSESADLQNRWLRRYVTDGAKAAAAASVPAGVIAAPPAARASAAASILTSLLMHVESRRAADQAQLGATVVQAPGEPAIDPTALDELLNRVEERARQYPENAARRVAAALPGALVKPADERQDAVREILEREGRNEQLHIEAQFGRLAGGLNVLRVKATSPQGGFWSLGLRRLHCPVCLAMAGKFWPWEVLDKLHPRVHFGCGCKLSALDDALAAGQMTPADIRPVTIAMADARWAIRESQSMPGRLNECCHSLVDPDLFEALAWRA